MNKIILVHYINVGNLKTNDVQQYLEKVKNALFIKNKDIINYIIPVKSETRIECLNPKLVSDEDYSKAKDLLDRNQKIVDEILEWKNTESKTNLT
jgi:hypothetical protein